MVNEKQTESRRAAYWSMVFACSKLNIQIAARVDGVFILYQVEKGNLVLKRAATEKDLSDLMRSIALSQWDDSKKAEKGIEECSGCGGSGGIIPGFNAPPEITAQICKVCGGAGFTGEIDPPKVLPKP
jgi:hypothetical protein